MEFASVVTEKSNNSAGKRGFEIQDENDAY